MALPASGQITLNQVNVELGNSGTAQIGMNDAAVRGLFGIASGEIKMSDGYGKSSANFYGPRGLFMGGNTGSFSNVIQYVTIGTTGNATDFGDLSYATYNFVGACTSGSRAVRIGGYDGGASGPGGGVVYSNVMDYVTVSTLGNATDFGDLAQYSYSNGSSATSDGSRGLWGGFGAEGSPQQQNSIQYITIATTGNSVDFGDLSSLRSYGMAGSNGTRAVFGGGFGPVDMLNAIEYVTIQTTGNSTDFGDLAAAQYLGASASSDDRVLFAGGRDTNYAWLNTIQYIDPSSTGNSTDFGDLVSVGGSGSGTSDGSRAIFSLTPSAASNVIQYVTISTTGNATDFGDLLAANTQPTMTSGG